MTWGVSRAACAAAVTRYGPPGATVPALQCGGKPTGGRRDLWNLEKQRFSETGSARLNPKSDLQARARIQAGGSTRRVGKNEGVGEHVRTRSHGGLWAR